MTQAKGRLPIRTNVHEIAAAHPYVLKGMLRYRESSMVSRVRTVAFQGIEAVPVDVQVMVAPGKVGMQILKWINFSYSCWR